MKRWLVAEGRVRSGWVAAAFAVLATTLMAVTNLLISRWQRLDARLDEPELAWLSAPTLVSAVVTTLVLSWAFRERIGLSPPALRRFTVGASFGAVALGLCVLGPVIAGDVTLRWPATPPLERVSVGALEWLTLSPAGAGEELLLRGLPLVVLARGTRPWVAVVLTSVTFGALHLLNPSASLVAALNVALVGAWFGLLARRSGSLWTSIGAHVTWNWFEGFVFGHPVSGIAPGRALISASWPAQRGFWSGGAFGPEASGWTSVVLLVSVVVALRWRWPNSSPTTTVVRDASSTPNR